MSTETKEKEEVQNPFSGFSILNGGKFEFSPKKSDNQDSTKTATAKVKEDNTKKKENKAEETEEESDNQEDNKTKDKKDIKQTPKTKKVGEESKSKPDQKEDNTSLEEEELDEKTQSSATKSKQESDRQDKTEDKEDEGSFKAFADFLKDQGIVDFKDEEFEDSEEGLKDVYKKSVAQEHDRWKKSYPEEAQKFLEFIESGGDPKLFHDIYYNSGTGSFADFKIEDEDNQKHAIREGLILAGWENEDEINDEISLYEDSGKLESKAKMHLERLQKYEAAQKEQLLISQKEYQKKQFDDNKKLWDDLKKGLFDKEDISGFRLTPKLKESVWEHMSKPVTKEGKTALQVNNEKNKDAQYLYALLDYLNWDISKLEKQVKTKVTSELRAKLGKYTDNRNKIKQGRTDVEDYEDENKSNPFEAFRSIKIGQ